MTFGDLALICLVGLAGPLLALRQQWHLPVVLGPLLGGILLGRTGFQVLHPADPTFTFLADIGFALVMFVAGTHVPVRDPRLRPALRTGVVRAVAVGAVAGVLGYVVARAIGTSHAPLYAVLMASSSAAVILPVVESVGLGGDKVIALLPQVAIADAACIVLLPLAIDPTTRCGRPSGRWSWSRPACWRTSCSGGWSPPGSVHGCTTCPSSATSRSSCGSAWPCCSRWPRSRCRCTSRSCWPASRWGWPSVRWANRAGWPGSCSPSPRASSHRCSSSGSARRCRSGPWRRALG